MGARIPGKARVLTVVVIVSNVAGNLLLSMGMKGPSVVLAVAGVALLTLWMLTRMTLMSWADLTYVLPVTSIGYVLTAVCGVLFLGEYVSPTRWAATLLIVAGTALAGTTEHKTT